MSPHTPGPDRTPLTAALAAYAPAADLPALVQAVATARRTTGLLQATLSAARRAWESAHADLLATVAAARTAQEQAETVLRTAVLAAYAAGGSKRPHPAVGVRVTLTVHYDEAALTAWARTQMPALLKLDPAQVALTARHLTLPGVQLIPTPQATIGGDLTRWTTP